ncbi:hypothetical protein D3C87_1996270 [compost metagenome]
MEGLGKARDGIDVARTRRRLDIVEHHEAVVPDGIDVLEGGVALHEGDLLLGGHLAVVDDHHHFRVLVDHRFPGNLGPALLDIVHDVDAAGGLDHRRRDAEPA